MKKLFLLAAFIFSFSAFLSAQSNFVGHGYLLQNGMISVCWKPGTHVLKYSNIQLRPETGYSPNLSGLVNQYVRVEGTYTYSPAQDPICPLQATVRKVTLAKDRLEMVDRLAMGNALKYSVYGPAGSFAFLMIGPDYKACLPMGTWGSLFLDITSTSGYMFFVGSSIITTTGVWNASIPIPNAPFLQYKRFKFQAALIYPNPGLQPNLVNAVNFQVR